MSTLPATTDVLIVGAGPTGLALALALRQLGVDPVVLDLTGQVNDTTRAAGVQPRTLEDLARLGIAEQLLERGVKGAGFRAASMGGTLLEIDYSVLGTPYPFVLLVPQNVTEGVLRDGLADADGAVFARHRLLSLDPEFDAVTATVADADGGLHAIRARYLVGCDGLHSGVRTRSGIGFAGTDHDQNFALADVRVEPDDKPPHVDFMFSPEGVLLRSPLPGGVLRVVGTVASGVGALDRAGVQALIDARTRPDDRSMVTEVVQSSSYHVSSRLADRFSKDRVFLVGDAAHVHSPAGGQGMNTGIQDAVNLAWKLAAVLGGDHPGLLDSYDAERRPNAAGVLATTGQITTMAELTDPATMALRDDVLRAVAAVPAVPTTLAGTLSQLDVAYRGPHDTRPEPVGRRLPITEAPEPGLAWSTGVLADGRAVSVRPDGYVDGLVTEVG